MSVEKMKYYYDNGLWSIDRLNKLLATGRISQEDYDFITGITPVNDDTQNSE